MCMCMYYVYVFLCFSYRSFVKLCFKDSERDVCTLNTPSNFILGVSFLYILEFISLYVVLVSSCVD